jgi:hypothetical protein
MLHNPKQDYKTEEPMYLNPAQCVVRVFGGVRATARAIGRTPGAITRWNRPKEEGGTCGQVPSAAQRAILKVAKKKKLDLTPDHLAYGKTVSK